MSTLSNSLAAPQVDVALATDLLNFRTLTPEELAIEREVQAELDARRVVKQFIEKHNGKVVGDVSRHNQAHWEEMVQVLKKKILGFKLR